MTDCILCVDIGTTSLKAACLTDKPGEVFVSRQHFKNASASEWMDALARAVEELSEKNKDFAIEAICVSGNGPTIVSEDGTTLLHNAPILESIQSEIENLNTKSLFIPRLYAFKKLFNESWQNSARVFSGPEFLIFKLTGKAISILPEERYECAYWSESEFLRCGFCGEDFKKLPDFVSPGTLAGQLNEETAIKTGLLEGTLVFAGGPDFTVALLGTGTVFPGRMCDRAGSSEGLNLCTQNPVFEQGLRTLPSVIPGLWNLSCLFTPDKDNRNFGGAVEKLRGAAKKAGEYFPQFMIITGGQALDKKNIEEKEKISGMKIKTQYCADAELIGDLILARIGLGDYDSIEEAVMVLG